MSDALVIGCTPRGVPTMIYDFRNYGPDSVRWTHRTARRFLGVGAAAWSQGAVFAAKAAQFPKGAVIRTVLKDISPDSVTGETLFHEHLSVAYSRTERQLKLPPPS